MNDFQKQQEAAEKAIIDQINKTNDLTNIIYLPENTQKQIREQIKNSEDIKRAADAALRGDTSGKENFQTQTKLELKKWSKVLRTSKKKINNKINALLNNPEDKEIILANLSYEDRTRVETAVAKEIEYRKIFPELVENYQVQLANFISNCLTNFRPDCDATKAKMSSYRDKIRSQDFENVKAELAASVADKNPTQVVAIFDQLGLNDTQRSIANKKIQEYSDQQDKITGAITYLATRPEISVDIFDLDSKSKELVVQEVQKERTIIADKESRYQTEKATQLIAENIKTQLAKTSSEQVGDVLSDQKYRNLSSEDMAKVASTMYFVKQQCGAYTTSDLECSRAKSALENNTPGRFGDELTYKAYLDEINYVKKKADAQVLAGLPEKPLADLK